jgi:hypothetical protein
MVDASAANDQTYYYGTRPDEVSIMAQQRGKAFEKELSASFTTFCTWPEFRMRDPVGGVGAEQPADYCGLLPGVGLVLEAKSTAQNAWPLRNLKPHQLDALRIADEMNHAAYVALNFRRPPEHNRCFAIPYLLLQRFIDEGTRASIPMEWCETWALELHRVDLPGVKQDGEAKKTKGWGLDELVAECLILARERWHRVFAAEEDVCEGGL